MQKNTFLWICRVIAALILLSSLMLTLTSSPPSVFIFTKMQMTVSRQINISVTELIAVFLLLRPKTYIHGAVMALVLMVAAIYAHVFVIGIEIINDHGIRFMSALLVFTCSIAILWLSRASLVPPVNNITRYNLNDPFYLKTKKKLRNWFILSLLVIAFISFPIGLLGLIYSIESRIKLKRMDLDGAEKASRMAGLAAKTGGWLGMAILIFVMIEAAIKNF